MVFVKIKGLFNLILKCSNPLEYIKDYFGLTMGKYYLRFKKPSLKLVVRGNTYDRAVINEVFLLDEYNLKEYSDVKTILDIGAHVGYFTMYAKRSFPNSQVFLYEANKDNFQMLKKNLKINNIAKVKANNVAVAGKTGKIKFYKSQTSVGHSFARKTSKYDLVKCISLSDILKKEKLKKIDLLKIDIEGGEYDVFYNTPKKDLDKIQYMLLEWHNVDEKKQNWQYLAEYLRKKGFLVCKKDNYLFCKR